MHTPQPLRYALEPPGTFKSDPDHCAHCRRNRDNPGDPEYRHRHWRETEPSAPVREDGPVWRFLFWCYSDWGIGRRRSSPPGPGTPAPTPKRSRGA